MFKVLACLTLLSFGANAACIGEAQIIGSVSHVKKTATSCRIFLSPATRIQTSMVCPLDLGKLFNEGIEHGHDCLVEAGSPISGILVDNGDYIHFD